MLGKILAITSLLIAFGAPMTLAAEENGLTAIGLDENGKEIEFPMGTRIWKKKVTKVLKRVGGGVIPGLDNTIQSAEKFELGQVDVGLYVKMKMTFITICVLLSMTNVSNAKEGYLSSYWHQSPEDQITGSVDKSAKARDLKSIDTFLTNVQESQLDAFDEYEAGLSVNKASGKKGWHLAGFQTSLGLGFSGKLGLLSWGGTKTIEIDWARRTKKEEKKEEEALPATTVVLTSDVTKNEMHQEIEPVIQDLVKSKRVTDEKALRKNVIKAANKFYAFSKGLNDLPQTKWAASTLRIDIAISASGKIIAAPFVKVGADVRLRLEWVRIMSNDDKRRRKKLSKKELSEAETKIAASTKTLFSELAIEVTNAYENLKKENKYDHKGFTVDSIQVGLGISLEGKVGVASIKGGVTPSVFFKRFEGTSNKAVSSSTKGTINLIVDNERAKAAKISHDKGVKESIFKMKSKRVQKGIKKALKFGHKFAKKFNKKKYSKRKWGVKKIKSAYTFSFGGSLGPVKLSASPQMAIYFKNQSL